jgi:hypothetical protein
MEMRTELQGMQNFLFDICEVSALAEERGITRRSSYDQLFRKANEVGLEVSASSTLDELREAAEDAYERIKANAS